MIEHIAQFGFPIAITIYLLYERTKFNYKITQSLERIVVILERIDK